jgi:hypothetical protein
LERIQARFDISQKLAGLVKNWQARFNQNYCNKTYIITTKKNVVEEENNLVDSRK